jgi:hypothetical protein
VIENDSSILVRIGIVQEKFEVMENEENAYFTSGMCNSMAKLRWITTSCRFQTSLSNEHVSTLSRKELQMGKVTNKKINWTRFRNMTASINSSDPQKYR